MDYVLALDHCGPGPGSDVAVGAVVLAFNLAIFLSAIELPEAIADRSLTSPQLKQTEVGAHVVRHARAIAFQPAKVAVTGAMVRAIFAAIQRSRAPALSA